MINSRFASLVWAVAIASATFGIGWAMSGEIGYQRGLDNKFHSCTIAFSRERLITEDHCNFGGDSTDQAWIMKMIERNQVF